MWELYLRGAATSFYEHQVVWQIQLARNVFALPNFTRDYISARGNEKPASNRGSPRTIRAPHRRRIERL
jgi:hypothetical protein